MAHLRYLQFANRNGSIEEQTPEEQTPNGLERSHDLGFLQEVIGFAPLFLGLIGLEGIGGGWSALLSALRSPPQSDVTLF